MPESTILYFGQIAKVNCDGNCKKAWGINHRPFVLLDETNADDFAYLADNELDDAPIDPGTYEGGHAKPLSAEYFPNKWCVRECERCAMSRPGEYEKPLAVRDFGKRRYNIPSAHNAAGDGLGKVTTA